MMNATAPIPALETKWRGYRFRSRCEARWAVFFDALRIPFEYEKEGFDLPSGRYLPDFWLPREKVWAEVKGQKFTERESCLCDELILSTGHSLLMLVGAPDFREYTLRQDHRPFLKEYRPLFWDDRDVPVTAIEVTIGNYRNPPDYSDFWYGGRSLTDGALDPDDHMLRPDYAAAVYASRAERFGT